MRQITDQLLGGKKAKMGTELASERGGGRLISLF